MGIGNMMYAQLEADYRLSVSNFLVQQKDSTYIESFEEVERLYELEKYDESLKKALVLQGRIEGEKELALEYECNFLIGSIFRKRGNHKNALHYFQKALALLYKKEISEDALGASFYKKNKKSESLAETLLRVGSGFFMLQQQDSAERYFKRIFDLPSLSNNSGIRASAYSNLSGIYVVRGSYKLAKEFALKAIEIYRENKQHLLVSGAMNNLASVYVDQKQYAKAKEIYTDAIDLIQSDTSVSAMNNKEDLYYNLAYTLYLQKDYKAYDYLEQSYGFKDVLGERELQRIVKGVYAEYQEQYKVELYKNRIELEKNAKNRNTWFLAVLTCLIIATSVVLLYGYRLRQRNLQLKLEQTKLEQKRKLEKLRSESQVRILNATLDGKETERKQIAETLHDSVSSMLSSANLHLQATKMQFNGDGVPLEVDKTQEIIVEAAQIIRDLSHTLVSSVLLKFGLKYAIEDMAQKYSNSKIEIHTDIQNIGRYEQSFEIKVNNIIQEFVNNILKHSYASKAVVRIAAKNRELLIRIEDDGVGFDKKLISEKDGLGINQIDARIHMMKGHFKIDSSLNNGARIAIELPIVEK